MTATEPAIKAIVEAMLRLDSVENYNSPEDVEESVSSEIEATREITAEEADQVGEMCAEWFAREQ